MKWPIFFCLFFLILNPKWHFDPRDLFPITERQNAPSPSIPLTYSYLGEGAQMYAFVSDDGKTVLKLFKARHKKPGKISRFLRTFSKDHTTSQAKWAAKFAATTMRYKQAFSHLQEETGLLYLHFAKTNTPLPVVLQDRFCYQVDLSNVPFILQKRAELIPNFCQKNPDQIDEVKKALKALFSRRIEKGYSDKRQSLRINYGIVDGQAIQIDVGKIEPFTGDKTEEIRRLHARVEHFFP